MFSQGKIPYEVGKVFYGTDKADWSVGIRKDGNLKTFLTFPADMFEVEERQKAFSDIQIRIREGLEKEKIKIDTDVFDIHLLHGRPCLSYVPEIPKNTGDYKLTKYYDTHEAFQEAQKNNDLVVVAGDSSNDLEMLNPGHYLIDYFTEDMYKRHGGMQLVYSALYPKGLIKLLDKDPEIAEIYMKMPFRGVIVRQNGGENKLHQLEPFASGKYQKIIIVDEGELQSGIKQSIKAYAEQNPKYKEKLSPDLKKQIEPESPKKPPKDDEPGGNSDDGESP